MNGQEQSESTDLGQLRSDLNQNKEKLFLLPGISFDDRTASQAKIAPPICLFLRGPIGHFMSFISVK
jgi:hypothetical protein